MKRKVLLIVLLLAFVGYAGWSFADSVTPYVGIKEAKAATSSNVQVKGLLAQDAPAPHMEGDDFVFTCRTRRQGSSCPFTITAQSRISSMKRITSWPSAGCRGIPSPRTSC